ncbi:type II secretion system protein [Pelomonas sp. SE-A7]|uniref:type II secretion system protein n=1 Tax=Pelomonas sp. SE-A7 TaxID=3054953 RepID=UPI00259CB853|nr:type II secretion system protein [Pelomonas sp. SE-A7]MDM4767545.1 type II secretion system protein [Pelomonas sp. SE-A7]
MKLATRKLSADRTSSGLVKGFGLLEAIVALVVLATSGLLLFTWINQNLNGAARLKDAEARAQLQLEAQGWVGRFNPAIESAGEREVAGMKLAWRSTLVEPMRDEFNYGANIVPRWQLGLYRLDVKASRLDGSVHAEWQQVVAGWRAKPGFSESKEGAGR